MLAVSNESWIPSPPCYLASCRERRSRLLNMACPSSPRSARRDTHRLIFLAAIRTLQSLGPSQLQTYRHWSSHTATRLESRSVSQFWTSSEIQSVVLGDI